MISGLLYFSTVLLLDVVFLDFSMLFVEMDIEYVDIVRDFRIPTETRCFTELALTLPLSPPLTK